MRLGKTQQYKQALQALQNIKEAIGPTAEVRAIATYLLYSDPVECARPQFPFVGIDDPRDQAVVNSYNLAWQQFVAGLDDDE